MSPKSKFEFEGFTPLLDRLEKHIMEAGPYDVLLSFSHGSNVLTLLTSRMQQRAAAGMPGYGPPSWKLTVLISGMAPRAEYIPHGEGRVSAFDPQPVLEGPCILVMGKRDVMVGDWGRFAVPRVWKDFTLIEHDGDHSFPSEAVVNRKIAEAIWSKARRRDR